MVRAQNDVYMVVNNNGAAINAKGDNTLRAVEEGKLTKGELQRCAMNILRFLLASPAAKREVRAACRDRTTWDSGSGRKSICAEGGGCVRTDRPYRRAGMIQTNGTRGNRYIQRICKAVLSKDLYELSVEHIKPGIKLLSVQFVKL